MRDLEVRNEQIAAIGGALDGPRSGCNSTCSLCDGQWRQRNRQRRLVQQAPLRRVAGFKAACGSVSKDFTEARCNESLDKLKNKCSNFECKWSDDACFQ
jgi:hypothetical protein